MRPLHALTLVLLLAVALGGAIWLASQDLGAPERPALAGTDVELSDSDTAPEPEDLALAGPAELIEQGSEEDRARIETPPEPGGAVLATGAKARVTGRVVHRDGGPIAGAELFSGGQVEGLSLTVTGGNRGMSQAVTDAEGRFAIPAPGEPLVRLRLVAEGFAEANLEFPIARGRDTDIGDLVLERGQILAGLVLDANGRAVARAEIFTPEHDHAEGFLSGMDNGRQPDVVTDQRGAFELSSLPRGPWRILVRSNDYADQVFQGEEPPTMESRGLRLTLADGVSLGGRLLGMPAESAADVKIYAQPQEPGVAAFLSPEALHGLFTPSSRASVAPDGRFVLRGLFPKVPYRIFASDQGGSLFDSGKSEDVTMLSEDGPVELHWKAHSGFEVRVVHAETGEPLNDFDIAPEGTEFGFGFGRGEPAVDGVLRCTDLEIQAGPMDLVVRAEGFEDHTLANISLPAGTVVPLGTVQLKPLPRLYFRVITESTGEPVERAMVTLADTLQAEGGGQVRVRRRLSGGADEEPLLLRGEDLATEFTDSEGRVLLSRPAAGEYLVRVVHKNFAPLVVQPFQVTAEVDQSHTLSLYDGGQVEVLVLDSEGLPQAGVKVKQRPSPDMPPASPFQGARTITDADGRVVFEHVRAGEQGFRAEAAKSTLGRIALVKSSGDEDGDDDDWTLTTVDEDSTQELVLAAPQLGTLQGRIYEAGQPLVGARVQASDPGDLMADLALLMGEGTAITTGSDGSYEIPARKPGPCLLKISHPSRSMPHEVEFELHEGPQEMDIDMAVSRLSGRVVDGEGKPLQGVKVRAQLVRTEDGPRQAVSFAFSSSSNGAGGTVITLGGAAESEVYTDAAGTFALRGVASERDIQVKAEGPEWKPTTSEVLQLEPGVHLEGLELVMLQGGRIQVSVVDAQGTGQVNHMLNLNSAGAGGYDFKVTDAEGLANFAGLEPGTYTVSWTGQIGLGSGDPDEEPPREVEVRAGETSEVEFLAP